MHRKFETSNTLLLNRSIGLLVLLVSITSALVGAQIERDVSPEPEVSELPDSDSRDSFDQGSISRQSFPKDVKRFCGSNQRTSIIGGKNSDLGAWPWQVLLMRMGWPSCGGSILSNEWIVTAAHCVHNPRKPVTVRVGTTNLSVLHEPGEQSLFRVRAVYVHPEFDRDTLWNDIALLKLSKPLKFTQRIKPICLPPNNIDLTGYNAVVTGWGTTRLADRFHPFIEPSVALQELQMPILRHEDCSLLFRFEDPPPSDTYLCAGFMRGGKDACKGDSGGPLAVRSSRGRWFIAGIVSYGHSCAKPKLPGIYTRVPYYNSWIISTINSDDKSKGP